MAAITPVFDSSPSHAGIQLRRFSGTGTANQADTLTSTAVGDRRSQRLKYVTVTYSAAPTQTGVTIELDSGLGAGFDATLATGTADAQDTVYIPDHAEFALLDGDAIRVSAPAGGAGITAAIAIVLEDVMV